MAPRSGSCNGRGAGRPAPVLAARSPRSEVLRRQLALAAAGRAARVDLDRARARLRLVAHALSSSPAPPDGAPDPLVLATADAQRAVRAARDAYREIVEALARMDTATRWPQPRVTNGQRPAPRVSNGQRPTSGAILRAVVETAPDAPDDSPLTDEQD